MFSYDLKSFCIYELSIQIISSIIVILYREFTIEMFSRSKCIVFAFSKTKVKVNMCGACSFNRDLEFLKYEIWKMDPEIQVDVEKSK